jgi:rod shape-determining protein MreD
MRLAKLALAIIAALLVELLAGQLHPQAARTLEPFVVLVVLFAVGANPALALIVGCLVGLTEDAVFGPLRGLHGFSGTLIAYMAAMIARQIEVQSTAMVAMVALVAVPLRTVIEASLLRLLLSNPPAPQPFWIGVQAVAAALLVVVALEGGGWSLRQWRRFRKRRRRVSIG